MFTGAEGTRPWTLSGWAEDAGGCLALGGADGVGAGRRSCLAASLPDLLTSPPRACRVLIIPGVAVFYFETKRGLLMGIQLKPAANICFDAAAAAGQAGGGGSRRRGPRCARQSRGWNAWRGRELGPAVATAAAERGPLRSLAAPGPGLPRGLPRRFLRAHRPSCAGPPAPRPFDPGPGRCREPAARGWRSGARGREGQVQLGAQGTIRGPTRTGLHTFGDSTHIYLAPTTCQALSGGWGSAVSQRDGLSQPSTLPHRAPSFQFEE